MNKTERPLEVVCRAAEFSACRKYRYSLSRQLLGGHGRCLFIMLNPSTADATEDDPTVRRCIGFAHGWGYRTLVVVNIFALRSTDPKVLKTSDAPIGPGNDDVIIREATKADIIVCAWGAHGKLYRQGRMVLAMLTMVGSGPPYHLGLTKAGQPKHPLYLKADTAPQRFA